MGRHHASRTDGGARSRVGQLDYDLSSTSAATVNTVNKGTIGQISVSRPWESLLQMCLRKTSVSFIRRTEV